METVPLLQSLLHEFEDKTMTTVRFVVDQVVCDTVTCSDATTKQMDRSLPLVVAYNHHVELWFLGGMLALSRFLSF